MAVTFNTQFTEAKLLAYADNELDPSDVGVIEDMMAMEPELARRAVVARLQRRLGGPAADRIAPPHGNTGFRPAPSGSVAGSAQRPAIDLSRSWPVAAGIAAILLVGIGYVAGQSAAPGGAPINLGQIENRSVQSALNRVPTGGSEAVSGGKVVIGLFIAADGSLCREFSLAAPLRRQRCGRPAAVRRAGRWRSPCSYRRAKRTTCLPTAMM